MNVYLVDKFKTTAAIRIIVFKYRVEKRKTFDIEESARDFFVALQKSSYNLLICHIKSICVHLVCRDKKPVMTRFPFLYNVLWFNKIAIFGWVSLEERLN